jgi:hypothetical protein
MGKDRGVNRKRITIMYNEKERKEMVILTKILNVFKSEPDPVEGLKRMNMQEQIVTNFKTQYEKNIKDLTVKIYQAIKEDLK